MILLYITSENKKESIDYIKEDDVIIKRYIGIFDINKFLIKDLKRLEHYDYIIIDIDAMKDNIETLENTIKNYKDLHSSRLVFIANEEDVIIKLIECEVYNILICITEDELKKELEIVMSEKGMSKEYIRKKAGFEEEPGLSEYKEKEYREFKERNKVINVVGTQERVGVTKICMNLSYYLNSIGCKVCYVEVNNNNHLKELAIQYEIEKKDKSYSYENIEFINYNYFDVTDKKYNFVICNFGIVNENNAIFLKDNKTIVVSGKEEYELKYLEESKRVLKDKEYKVIYNICSNNQEIDDKVRYIDDVKSDRSNKIVYEEIIK